MQTFLTNWITKSPRGDSQYSYSVNDIHPLASSNEIPVEQLAGLLQESYFGKVYLQGLVDRYGWQKVSKEILSHSVPTDIKVQRGDFAEAIAARWLEESEGYEFPVKKLRYKIRGNDTLHGTDCLALKLSDSGGLAEVCFVESKLRTSADNGLGIQGYTQLEADVNEVVPAILSFVGRQLAEKNHYLKQAFHDYIFSRDVQIETYKLWICYDESSWNEMLLQNLEDHGVNMLRFEVYVHLINQLAKVSDEVFALIGVVEVSDNDS